MAKLKVMCARSMHVAVGALGKAFAEGSGHKIAFDFGTVGALQGKLDSGETADVVILSIPGIDKLQQAGCAHSRLAEKRRQDLHRALHLRRHAAAGLFHHGGVQAAPGKRPRHCHQRPAVGGSAGVHLAKTFEQTGLAAMMANKSMPQQSGSRSQSAWSRAGPSSGSTLSGEVAWVPGAVIAGPVPLPFGQDTTYSAAVMAGAARRRGHWPSSRR